MKLNNEYLLGLLEAFEKADGPVTNIHELKMNGYPCDTDEFAMHTDILFDMKCITMFADKQCFYHLNLDGSRHCVDSFVRLTYAGHKFLAEHRKTSVFGESSSVAKTIGQITDIN